MCFSNKPWKWELIMEILAAPYTTGVLACVSVIRNVIRNKRCFWSSISSHKMKGFEFVSLLADGKFQSHCGFLSPATKSLFFKYVFQAKSNCVCFLLFVTTACFLKIIISLIVFLLFAGLFFYFFLLFLELSSLL